MRQAVGLMAPERVLVLLGLRAVSWVRTRPMVALGFVAAAGAAGIAAWSLARRRG